MHFELNLIINLTDNQLVVYYSCFHSIGVGMHSPNSLIFFRFQSHLETQCIFRV